MKRTTAKSVWIVLIDHPDHGWEGVGVNESSEREAWNRALTFTSNRNLIRVESVWAY